MDKADYALMAEYHRGYEDGKAARAADEWALQQKRIQVMNKVTEHLQSKLTSYKKLGYSIDNEAMMVNCLGFERSMSPFLHHVISEIVGKDEYSVTDVVNGLSELLGVDPNNDCQFVEYDTIDNDQHDDALSETIRNSDVYYARPSATHKPWVAKETQPTTSVAQATIDTRQNTYDSMCLEIDRLNTSMGDERQMYLDLLRDAARDYRSLQQADELRTHVLDAAIEENKSLRRKLKEPDTPESIVRDLTLGNVSESDAIRIIEKLGESE